jgi:hypothetical protein
MREVSSMAWNGSWPHADSRLPPYTAWRNTPAEAAMRDFMVTHANLPLGARLWNFGAPGYLDDDGWRLEKGQVHARGGHVDLEFDSATATLLSPPDQVIRAATTDSLILGLENPSPLAAVQIFARLASGAPWISLGEPVAAARFGQTAAGVRIPLTWPPAWRRNGAIAAELKIVMAFDFGVANARLDSALPRRHCASAFDARPPSIGGVGAARAACRLPHRSSSRISTNALSRTCRIQS